jgi:glycosyltransferase involved in cell wall biosynthesis
MLISVIVPTYNRKNVLRHVLLALINQDVNSYEVIICDDGSNDGTKEMIEQLKNEYKLPYELLYQHQEHIGFRAGQARNMGIKIARGEKLLFIDHDVIPMPNVLGLFNTVWKGTILVGRKKLISLDFYKNITDDIILNNFSEFDTYKHGMLKASLSSFGVIHKEDLDKAEGFDEDFIGWGLEDSELEGRLYDIGIYIRVKVWAYGYHIEHEKNSDKNNMSKETQEIYHYKRKHSKKDGKKILVSR